MRILLLTIIVFGLLLWWTANFNKQKIIDVCSQSDSVENCERNYERSLRDIRLKQYQNEGK